MTLSHDRYADEIVAQTEMLRVGVEDADPGVAVPSCPGWTVGQLLRHVGGAHREAEAAVRSRASEAPQGGYDIHQPEPRGDDDPVALGRWLVEGAESLAAALREAGPDLRLWTPVPAGTAGFYARRMTHETVMHRADAFLALGRDFDVDQAVAVDTVDEWMELGSLPMHFTINPRMRDLLGPGRTLHLHATDAAPGVDAEWLVDLTGDRITWRRAHEKAAVAVRGPLTALLLLIYRRRTVADAGVEVLGDADLLDFWLDHVAFG